MLRLSAQTRQTFFEEYLLVLVFSVVVGSIVYLIVWLFTRSPQQEMTAFNARLQNALRASIPHPPTTGDCASEEPLLSSEADENRSTEHSIPTHHSENDGPGIGSQ
jgi:hypothetical protein